VLQQRGRGHPAEAPATIQEIQQVEYVELRFHATHPHRYPLAQRDHRSMRPGFAATVPLQDVTSLLPKTGRILDEPLERRRLPRIGEHDFARVGGVTGDIDRIVDIRPIRVQVAFYEADSVKSRPSE